MTTHKHHRQSCLDRIGMMSTITSVIWISLLCLLELVVSERNGPAAFLSYLPQHLFGIPVLASLLISLIARNSRQMLVNILIAAVFMFTLMGLNVSLPAREGPNTIRVMTWNIHGYHSRPGDILAVIQSQKPDVVCLQEVIPADSVLQSLQKQGWYVVSIAEVAVATRWPHVYRDDCILLPGSGRRAQTVTIKVRGRQLDIWSVHFATSVSGARRLERRAYLQASAKARTIQAAHLLEKAKRRNTIIAGDFNLPPRGIAYRRIASSYRDAFTAGNGLGYTYRSDLPLLRIDHIFLSHDLRAVQCHTVQTTASDHLPVVSVVKL